MASKEEKEEIGCKILDFVQIQLQVTLRRSQSSLSSLRALWNASGKWDLPSP